MRHLLLSLFVMGASVVNASSLSIFNPLFKDPQALHGNQHGLLLDIDVQTSCISNTQIQITLPLTSNPDTGNGHFSGSPFSNVPVTGLSSHSSDSASASVSWDGTTLTFSNFIGATRQGRDASWINFNFATATSQIPLNLVFNDDAQGQGMPFVNVNMKRVFTATNNDTPCQDAQ